MRVWICLAFITVAACGKPDCKTAIADGVGAMIEHARSTMPANAIANVERVAPEMTRVLTQACVDDHWAQPVIDCIAKAHSQAELNTCDEQLTKQQRDSEHKRTDEVLKFALTPHPPTAAGSSN